MEEEDNIEPEPKKNKVVIKIPSYQEVIESSQSKSTPPSLFAPSQSFSQAFSFVKSSEFYSPPPLEPPQVTQTTTSREYLQSNVASPLPVASTSSVASSSSSSTQNRNAILVSHRQAIPCLSISGILRYHLLHPDYLYYRIRELQKNFKLRVVLCHVDVEDVVKPLLEVTKTALLHDCTLLCGWSLEECGRYLETIKVYENKSADIIQGQMDTDYLSRLNHALTTVRHVNKTDVVTLGTTFGSLSHIMDASMEDLARCPGIGERKVKRLHDTFHEPFKRAVVSVPTVPETSTQNNVKPSSVNEDKEKAEQVDAENDGKRSKKEPDLTIKSALSAAFAKYADKVV
ncbi:hypothetical protein G4B88_003407 [Cannabis sativa]|uniref:ERCC1-like central domain-containing protein n=1 Tax=Cannabis sativa TaxID=3483 RepID=A0A7J6H3X1_CANSA|nr:hypothetical protein G4B88_003407 [Cannabis sativa]